jgi:ABC-type glycerol-3-phosphate transport system substrate-binding protein
MEMRTPGGNDAARRRQTLSRRRLLALPIPPLVAATVTACDLPKGILPRRVVLRLALPSGPAVFEDVAGAVERATALVNSGTTRDFSIESVRVPLPQRGTTSLAQVLAPRLASDQAPDILLLLSRTNDVAVPAGEVQELVTRNLLAPIDDLAKRDRHYQANAFYLAALEALRHRGQSYAQPLTVEPLVLYYDPELFAAAGLKPPDNTWDWQTLRDLGRRLTREAPDGQIDQWGIYSYPPYWLLMALIWQAGGDLFTPDGKASALAEPAAVEALQFFHDLSVAYRAAPPPPVLGRQYEYALRLQEGRIYAGGRARVAMGVGPGTTDISQVLQEYGLAGARFDLAIAEVPQGKQRATGMRVVSSLAVTAKSPHKASAYEALSALEREASRTLPLTARRGTVEQLRQVAPSLSAPSAGALINSLGYARVARPASLLVSAQLAAVLWQGAIAGMFTEGLSASQAARNAARELDLLLAR